MFGETRRPRASGEMERSTVPYPNGGSTGPPAGSANPQWQGGSRGAATIVIPSRFMKIRNVGKLNIVNDAAHSRSLFESIMMPELISALRDWTEAAGGGVLVGTAALSFHVRPRMSHDIDFLFIDDADIPTAIPGFSRISPVRLRHNRTGVEVTVVTPDAIQIPLEVAEEVDRMAIVSDGVRVVSESGLVALKLFRRSRQDEADIVASVKTDRVDLSTFPLSAERMAAFRELVEAAKTDPHPA